MYVVCVTVRVVPEQVEPFLQATLENARQSRHEPGNVRFDVLQAEAEPSQFFLYEVYRTKDDFIRHQQTPHYLRWKETVAPWMAAPRQGVRYLNCFPDAQGGATNWS
jgi:autoinducer 2-degrading protein